MKRKVTITIIHAKGSHSFTTLTDNIIESINDPIKEGLFTEKDIKSITVTVE